MVYTAVRTKHRRPQIAKPIPRNKNGAGRIRFPKLRLYYKATVTKQLQYWHKNRNLDQWIRIKILEINACTYAQLGLPWWLRG